MDGRIIVTKATRLVFTGHLDSNGRMIKVPS